MENSTIDNISKEEKCGKFELSNEDLIAYKTITSFVNDLCDGYGDTYHSLKLYNRLLQKTTLSNSHSIRKHISVFRNFSIEYRDDILNNNLSPKLSQSKIVYSDRVYIDIGRILKNSDKQTLILIFKHLLSISALLDPIGKAKEVLKKMLNSENVNDEGGIFNDIFSKISDNINPESNPMEAIGSILNSGVFTDIINTVSKKMEDGKLDLGKLMGGMQNMMSNIPSDKDTKSEDGGVDGGVDGGIDVNMISNMMSMVMTNLNQERSS